MIRTALLSRWHVHADDYARQAASHPAIHIAAVWDEEETRGRSWAQELGVPFYAELEEVLADPDIDGVIVSAPTVMHYPILMQAARHGKHIFSEKVLALKVEEIDEIFHAATLSGSTLQLALKRLAEPYYVYAQSVLEHGWLGKLTLLRCRLAHPGGVPREGSPYGILPAYFFDHGLCGGGALMDLGAHPICLVNRLGGRPQGVYARLEKVYDREVEDHAALIVDYEGGLLGIIEAGFVSNNSFHLELHGTEGVLLIENGAVRLRSVHEGGNQWMTVTELPAKLRSPLEQWADQVLHGTPPDITYDDMRMLTELNEAATASDREGRRISLR